MPEETPPTKPEGVPDKYWDSEKNEVRVDALVKSEADGRAKITEQADALKAAKAAAAKPAPTPEPPKASLSIDTPKEYTDDDGIGEVLSKIGLDPAVVASQFSKEGKLTDDQYTAIKRINPSWTKKVVNQVIGNDIKVAELTQGTLKARAEQLVGGEKQFNALAAWAQTTYSPEQLATYEAGVRDPDPNKAMEHFELLAHRYNASVGSTGSKELFHPSSKPSLPVGGYATKAEMAKARTDPRYRKDPVYRASVIQRIGQTDDSIIGRSQTEQTPK